jgi:hypothetical protein
MADDVWSALVKGYLGFAHTRAGDMAETSAADSVSLVGSLIPGASEGKPKEHLKKLKKDFEAAGDAFKPIMKEIEKEIASIKDSVNKMGAELGKSPFNWENAAGAATHLGYILVALDAALVKVAKKAAEPEPDPNTRALLERDIRNIPEPWKKPFRNLASGSTKTFDSLCKTVLNIDNAGGKIADRLAWDREKLRLALTLTGIGPVGLGPANAAGVTPLNLDGASIEAFFSYKDTAKLGIALRTQMRAGMRADKMLERIIPEQAPTVETSSIAIALDTKDGLTFGDGPNRKITLPVRFNFPGIELREMAIGLPETKDPNSGRIDLMITVAGKLGDTLGVVAEGGGVILRWKGDPGAAVEVLPKPPYAAGLRLRTALVNGGGFLRYKEDKSEYGGMLDLQFGTIGITAFGLYVPDPFSLAVVMGLVFRPRIELSFGFTLNGLGGIIAINRSLSATELGKALQQGGLDQLLFPSDPIAAAPKILDRLGAVFPAKPGGFVVGPIALLGWGSQAGFVKAKLGVVLSLPDPVIAVLGVLSVVVPTPETPRELRTVDFHLEVASFFTADYFKIIGSLVASKLAQVTVTGDMGLLIRWGGEAEFAISAGGFFPHFRPPPELADMRRLALDFSPPIDLLKVHAEAYFAIASNSLQFGGGLSISADVGIASGKAWVLVDALFKWTPHIFFIFRIEAGIEIKVLGETFAGVTFRGTLWGMTPWRLEGHASVTVFFKDIPFDLGPWDWGESPPAPALPISPVKEAAQALSAPAAWKPQLPAGMDTLARFIEDDLTPLLVHPLGQLEIKQLRVPLETAIDRIGSSPVTSRRVHLDEPKFGTLSAQDVSHARDYFAPGHFLNLSEDEQISRQHFEEFPCGIRMTARGGVAHGPAMSIAHVWETVYPHEEFGGHAEPFVQLGKLAVTVLQNNGVARAAREKANPYLPPVPVPDPEPYAPREVGRVVIARRDDLSAVAGATEWMTTTAAAERIAELAGAHDGSLQLVTTGVSL